MRIAVLTTSYPRTADEPAGHFVRSAAMRLAAKGHEVHVIAPGGSVLDRPEITDGIHLHHAGGGSLFAWPGAAARAKEAPWRLLATGTFGVGVLARLRQLGAVDQVVAHWIVPCAFPLAVLGSKAALEVVAHGADVRLLMSAPRPAREAVLRALLDRGACFHFAAGSLLRALEGAIDEGLAKRLAGVARIEHPAIDVPDVAEAGRVMRASLGLGENERLAVAVGRLIASKRVGLAIDAAARVPGLRLVVVGDGPERAALERRAAGSGARVTFPGNLHRREALAWVAAADVLVHASAVEAAPTVIREARELGVPVVACDAGDVRDWAHDDPGIVVAEATPEDLASAVGRALTMPPPTATTWSETPG